MHGARPLAAQGAKEEEEAGEGEGGGELPRAPPPLPPLVGGQESQELQ